jgi:predicted N-formylglutamate amidohydrolase
MSGGAAEVGPDAAEPPAVTLLNEAGSSPFVLLCEHASNYIPAAYRTLGLPPEALERHIAWDIGAADLARHLSALLDAPLFLSGYSRLLIDLNRPLSAPSSIPEVSEATVIPGNHGLGAEERARRTTAYFTPFHDRVSVLLDGRAAAGCPATVIGVHSFTPVLLDIRRPWHAGVLYGRAAGFASALITHLAAEDGLVIGDNEPYRIETDMDYTVPVHGDQRGTDAVLLEVRQDLLEAPEARAEWAARLAAALSALVGRQRSHIALAIPTATLPRQP